MKKYLALMLFFFWGCEENTSADDDLVKSNPMAFSVLLGTFEKESAPDFDSHVLAYAKLKHFDDKPLGISSLAFNDIVTYFPKTASFLLKHKKCSFFLLKQKKEDANTFDVLSSINSEEAIVYRFYPTNSKGKVCNPKASVDHWAFLIEDCSGTWDESISVTYKTYESTTWKCEDVAPFATQNEWISPSLL